MNIRRFVIGITAIVVMAASAACAQPVDDAAEPRIACRAFGGISEQVCPTSIIRLISRPEDASEKVIAVQGWPKQIHDRFYLFVDQSSADSLMLENSIVCVAGCDRLASRIGVKTTLIGRFTTDIARNDLFSPAGAISVNLIREID